MVYLLEPPVYRNPGHRACSTGCMCRSGYGITAPVPDGPVWGGAAVSSAPTASVARGRWERRRSRRLSPRWQPRRMWPRPPGTRHCRRCCFLNGWCWGGELPQMAEVVRGRRLRRLPVVLSQEEVARLPQALPERERELMARLRYRTGMCLLERQRLRIKCVDFVGREISGHSDKGGRDRCVPLPESLRGRRCGSAGGRWCCRARIRPAAMAGSTRHTRRHANTPVPMADRVGLTCFLSGAYPSIYAVAVPGAST